MKRIVLVLPCGKRVYCPESWLSFLPFWGCHDFCPEDKMESCVVFRKKYDLWLKGIGSNSVSFLS